jgi:DNA-binding transcriptional LysR family regulator
MTDLNRLALFVRVVEASSFTVAARSLGLRTSSVSRGVARLEEELGVSLLHRTTRNVSLTDAGRAYYDRVREALSGVEEATADVLEKGYEPQGVVRLTAAPMFAAEFLADALGRFVQRYSKIRLELVLTSRHVDLVEGGIDIAVRLAKLRDSSLVARKLVASELRCFAAPSYLRRRGTPKSLRDLVSHDCLLYRPEAGKNTWRLTGPTGDETVEVTGAIGADDLAFLHRATLSGSGIGLLPLILAIQHVEKGELVPVLPEYGMRGGAIYLLSPPARHKLARVRLLHDFLAAELPKAWKV